jgi:hypothetical protein
MTATITDFITRAAGDYTFAAALEAIVGGTPDATIEAADEKLIEAYIDAHGAEHLLEHVERHVAYLASVAPTVEPAPVVPAAPAKKGRK